VDAPSFRFFFVRNDEASSQLAHGVTVTLAHGKLRIRDDAHLALAYDDRTPFGSASSGLSDRLIRRTCRPLFEKFGRLRTEEARCEAPRLLGHCFGTAALGRLYRRPGQLHEDCLYPPPDLVAPRVLNVRVDGRHLRASLAAGLDRELAHWLGAWSLGSAPPGSGAARTLWDALASVGALCSDECRPPPAEDGLTFVGHATVAFRRCGTRLVFDPFMPPQHSISQGRGPLSASELAPSAVFITHSHPDHFDVGALLRLGPHTPIYVPVVPRESLLSVDMAARLRELGFTTVSTLSWGSSVAVGPFRVTARPFFGEQPTPCEVFHPEVCNEGNSYIVEDGTTRTALIADAGVDRRGDIAAVAAELAQDEGPIDLLFGGYRAFRLHPAQYLTSSVARYLLFVPPALWTKRFAIMNDAHALLHTGRMWGARQVVPYANGGAPWYWENGLGPRLDGDDAERDPDIDPIPDVVLAAREHTDMPAVLLLQPGQHHAVQP
jgi:L-ascorbate metabolism protein UlaG (beta-lactamase superfamily)